MITIFNEHKDQFIEVNYIVKTTFKTAEAFNTLFLSAIVFFTLS